VISRYESRHTANLGTLEASRASLTRSGYIAWVQLAPSKRLGMQVPACVTSTRQRGCKGLSTLQVGALRLSPSDSGVTHHTSTWCCGTDWTRFACTHYQCVSSDCCYVWKDSVGRTVLPRIRLHCSAVQHPLPPRSDHTHDPQYYPTDFRLPQPAASPIRYRGCPYFAMWRSLAPDGARGQQRRNLLASRVGRRVRKIPGPALITYSAHSYTRWLSYVYIRRP